jgi:hypothetical protein
VSWLRILVSLLEVTEMARVLSLPQTAKTPAGLAHLRLAIQFRTSFPMRSSELESAGGDEGSKKRILCSVGEER